MSAFSLFLQSKFKNWAICSQNILQSCYIFKREEWKIYIAGIPTKTGGCVHAQLFQEYLSELPCPSPYRIFLTQISDLHLRHGRRILYCWVTAECDSSYAMSLILNVILFILKGKGILTQAVVWRSLENMLLSEERQKTTNRMAPFVWNLQNRQIHKRGWGRGWGDNCWGCRASLEGRGALQNREWRELPRWSSDWDSTPAIQEVWVPSLIWEPRSHMLHSQKWIHSSQAPHAGSEAL